MTAVEGRVFRLRPVVIEDAEFIFRLRSDEMLSRYLHKGAESVEEQTAWLRAYLGRKGDYYFIIERKESKKPEGLISLYSVNFEVLEAEWGRWLVQPQSLAALESVSMLYEFAFELLNLRLVRCFTVSDNEKVVSFHDSCGMRRAGVHSGRFTLNGKSYDAIEHFLEAADWAQVKSRLQGLILRLAKRMNG